MKNAKTIAGAIALLAAAALMAPSAEKKLPKLIDLGAKQCLPCKMMAPILEELKTDYADRFVTEFIDVWEAKNVAKAQEYSIKTIPTQIFFDAEGEELWRHEGFLSKEAILDKWKELGVAIDAATASDDREPAPSDDEKSEGKGSRVEEENDRESASESPRNR